MTHRFGRTGALSLALVALAAAPGRDTRAQEPEATFERTVADLGNDKPHVRLRAVQSLKQSAPPEAAIPLTRSIADPEDDIQFQAIAGELNIFLAEKVIPRKRVGLVVEVRNSISAPSLFDQGPGVFDPRPVPADVLNALRAASHDDNARVSVEALYAFGALSDNAYGPSRRALLSASVTELVAALGSEHTEVRGAAIRVITRLYSWRMGDAAVDQQVGDAVVTALNDWEPQIRLVAMDALGGLRYDRGVQALTDTYKHFDRGTTAAAALGALARIGHASSGSLFSTALASRDVPIRVAGIEGLARAGAVEQLGAINGVLTNERNPDVLLAGHFAGVLLANGAVDELVAGLAHDKLRSRALRYLVDIAPGRARLLGPHLEGPQPALRVDLLDVLGLSGDPDALTIARRLQQDADPAAARAARRAVMRLQGSDPPSL